MARNLRFMGPAAICDVCGRACCTLDQAGIPCYHCYLGIFIHRGEWDYSTCSACQGIGFPCKACHDTGVMARRRE